MAADQISGFIRDPVADQVNPCETGHCRHIEQRILHGWVKEVIPLLHQMNPHHRFPREGRPFAFRAGLGIMAIDQIDRRVPGPKSLHLNQETLLLGTFPGCVLLVITKSELLATHEPSHAMRSKNDRREDRMGFQEYHPRLVSGWIA